MRRIAEHNMRRYWHLTRILIEMLHPLARLISGLEGPEVGMGRGASGRGYPTAQAEDSQGSAEAPSGV